MGGDPVEGDTGGEDIILGGNLPGHWTLFIKGFNSNEFFQITHDCHTENVHRTQNFSYNLRLKTIIDTFSPNMCSTIKR